MAVSQSKSSMQYDLFEQMKKIMPRSWENPGSSDKVVSTERKAKNPYKKIQHFLPWNQQAALVGSIK